MFIPLTSDAGLRYWPFATGVMILLNCIAYAIQLAMPVEFVTVFVDPAELAGNDLEFQEWDDQEDLIPFLIKVPGYQPYILSHGDGLHPIQWLTSFFMHASLMHLIGNMLFLWIFGHLVEGAVGPWKFLALYLGMGILQNIIEQVLFLGALAGGSLGASSAIYAIMAVAAWLYPEDNIQGVFIVIYRFIFVEVPIFLFAVFYLLYDGFMSYVQGFAMSTPVLHAMGGVLGVVVGFVLLKFEIIENEGRDLLSFLGNRTGNRTGKPKPSKRQLTDRAAEQAAEQAERDRQRTIIVHSLEKHSQAGNFDASYSQWTALQRLFPNFVVPERQILILLALAQKQQRWPEYTKLADHYLLHYNSKEVPVRLNLAMILISKESRPNYALRVMQGLAGAELSEAQKSQAKKITAAALKMIEDGVVEISDS